MQVRPTNKRNTFITDLKTRETPFHYISHKTSWWTKAKKRPMDFEQNSTWTTVGVSCYSTSYSRASSQMQWGIIAEASRRRHSVVDWSFVSDADAAGHTPCHSSWL